MMCESQHEGLDEITLPPLDVTPVERHIAAMSPSQLAQSHIERALCRERQLRDALRKIVDLERWKAEWLEADREKNRLLDELRKVLTNYQHLGKHILQAALDEIADLKQRDTPHR